MWWLLQASNPMAAAAAKAVARAAICRVADAAWREVVSPPPPPVADPRWEPCLCGDWRVLEVDLRTPAGRTKANAAVAARLPIVMRHAAEVLQPAVCSELRTLEGVGALLDGTDVTVLKANAAARARFTYYQPNEQARHRPGSVMAPPPVNDRLIMTWREFASALKHDSGGGGGGGGGKKQQRSQRQQQARQRASAEHHYMQLALAARSGGISASPDQQMATRVSERILRSLQAAMRPREPHGELVSTLGPWTVSNLYVGPAGTLAPCHWDALDNTFVQLHGQKDVLLFPPTAAGMRTFPFDHPYYTRAQVDLERLDDAARAELSGRGALACLGPGDCLYIPHGWWHHIAARAGGATPVSISLNFWFDPSRELHEQLRSTGRLPSPPNAAMLTQMTREAEALASRASAEERARFFGGVIEALEAAEGRAAGAAGSAAAPRADKTHTLAASGTQVDEKLASIRTFVCQVLLAAFGQNGAASDYARTYLDARRWAGLRPVFCLDLE